MVNSFLKLVGILTVFTAIFLVLPLRPVQASVNDNIRGWADSSRGYISFNCLDDGFASHFIFTFPFTFTVPPCVYNQHGVNLNANNNFSGQAWNPILGFITFSSSSTPPDVSYRSFCESTCDTSNSCTACYRESDGQVYGYMRVESTGEWIKLDDPLVPPSTRISNYLTPQPGIFSGYASSSFGSIKFNCNDDSLCATNWYQVKIGPLEIRQLTAPNWGSDLACGSGAKKSMLAWNRRSGIQSAYQLIVSTENSTSSGWIFDTGKVSTSSAPQYYFTPPSYDVPYYWFLRLWDDSDTATPWRQFNTSGTKDQLTDNVARNSARSSNPNLTFTTYKHEFPLPSFTFSPTEILIATTTNSFVSSSYYYNGSNTLQPCTGSVCAFLWQVVNDPAAIVSAPTLASTSIMFTKATSTIVTLKATDNDSYFCSTSTILNVNYALPLWKEIKAP